ncbi:MAG: prepilin-type N-terminal cleavage/methylation domain-containing protein [Opitutus sp.]|nr:prepilin-type N-terminal cleavage/methylation domain-containing protein [Opitutus sp.]
MLSVTNNDFIRLRRSAPTRGFTLLEILLSIAIIALLAGAMVAGTAKLLNEQPVTADEVFWKAVQESRKTALKTEHEIRLKFDKEKKQFLIFDGLAPAALAADGITKEEVPLKVFPLPAVTATDLTIEFLGGGSKGGNTILVGGMLLESQPLPFVKFYSDGTCGAFRVQVARNGTVHTLAIDPWTCAPVLAPVDPNAL